MTFSNLTEENINQAIEYIDANGVPPGYKSKTTDLIVNGKAYPPKYVLAEAQRLAYGIVIDVKDFYTDDAAKFLQEKGFNIVKRVKESEMSDEEKFKHLLEYFVAHLEFAQSGVTNSIGYQTYIEPIKEHFTKTGNGGGKDWGLQKQIEKWESFSNGHKITITVLGHVGKKRFANTTSYLNWKDTWLNVRAKWDDLDERVVGIYLTNTPTPKPQRVGKVFNLEELCLYDGKAPNENLKQLFETFEKLIGEENMGKKVKEMDNLLLVNHNIILHGAPGTGKTYLAKQIAEEMKAEWEMVQFHQSYDYTDFVEGLRPAVGENDKADGFERKDGVFKAFCKKAIEASKIGVVDNYDECFQKIVTKLESENVIPIPLISGKGNFFIALNSEGDGFVTMLKDEKSDKFVKDTTRFFNYDQCYNVYRGLPGTPKKGFDNYRKAIVKYMKNNLGLKDYQAGKNIETSQSKKFVFIIDEINRGEMSKVFGELFFSIDPGYRGETGRIKTQYQNLVKKGDEFENGFYVPENVYIIGTMNDIDRSVESMDFAMRRRFAFEEITAEQSMKMFDNPKSWKDENNEIIKIPDDVLDHLKNRMRNLNTSILEPKFNLGLAYQIGGAYFLKFAKYYKNENDENDAFTKLWDYHLKGLLSEYLRGMPKAKDLLDKLEEAFKDDASHGPQKA